jgi:hypothetical protein
VEGSDASIEDEPATHADDAPPVSGSSQPVQALQTEMLFSMDGSGESDLFSTPTAAPDKESLPSPTADAPHSGDAVPAPEQKRISTSTEQDDVVDD